MAGTYAAKGFDIDCNCLSSSDAKNNADNIASCFTAHDKICETIICSEGWDCTNQSGPTVDMCITFSRYDHWEITSDAEWNRITVINEWYFIKGVSNIQSTLVQMDKTTTLWGCDGYYVDGQRCMSCELCEDSQGNTQVVGDCSNIVDGAVTTCEHTGILASLLVLDSAATRAPSCFKYIMQRTSSQS